MKPKIRLVAVFLMGMAGGLAVAWSFLGEGEPAKGKEAIVKERDLKMDRSIPFRNGDRSAVKPVPESTEPLAPSRIDGMRAEIAALSDEEFGKQMSSAWSTKLGATPEGLMRKALFLAACDGDRAIEFYAAYKDRKGMSLTNEGGQELRAVMTQLGRTDGKGFMEKLLAESPEGTWDMDSLMHGWAATNLDEAVEWMNSLPEDSPVFSKVVKGLVWSLGEVSPEAAMSVFSNLAPEERDAKTYRSLSSSVVQNQGIAALGNLAALAPDKAEQDRIFMHGMEYANYKPSRTFVKDMAPFLETYPQVTGNFSERARKWISVEPVEVLLWLDENAKSGASASALGLVAAELNRAGHQAELEKWLAENPDASGAAAVRGGGQ